jgi:transposase InsO family protein
MALETRRPAAGLVHHSDRGVRYASGDYTDLLKANGFEISMSRSGNPYDNAQCESFVKTLKYEEVYRNESSAGRSPPEPASASSAVARMLYSGFAGRANYSERPIVSYSLVSAEGSTPSYRLTIDSTAQRTLRRSTTTLSPEGGRLLAEESR